MCDGFVSFKLESPNSMSMKMNLTCFVLAFAALPVTLKGLRILFYRVPLLFSMMNSSMMGGLTLTKRITHTDIDLVIKLWK